MRKFLLLAMLPILAACSKDSTDPILGGGDDGGEAQYRYLIISNGEPVLNLYPKGMLGLAPGERTNPIPVTEDSYSIDYCWSDNTDDYKTLTVDFTGSGWGTTKTVTLKKDE